MRRNLTASLWFQAAILSSVVIIGIAVWGYFATKSAHQAARKPQQSTAKPQSTPLGSAKKGAEYLKNSLQNVHPHQRLMLDFLQRKFSLDQVFSAKTTPILIQAKGADEQREFDAIQRIAYPDRLAKDLGAAPSTVTMAANCDRIQLPKDYSQQLQAQAGQGGYELTHVAFSVQIAKELGCHVVLTDPLMKQARQGMVNTASSPDTPADLRYESIAFLQYTGYRKDIRKEWIDQIIAEQQADGSWSPGAGTSATTDHATVLALWALLEYNHPKARDEPLIRHQ